MTIDVKNGASNWGRVTQPSIKLSANAWTPLKRALVKANVGWKEVWPSEIVYNHFGTGYNMNMHACFGSPTSPATYIFINHGNIGGSLTAPALRSGWFPPGSTVRLINNGTISGSGGNGAKLGGVAAGPSIHAQPGGDGLLLDTFVIIEQGPNGRIQGGGGGGGVADERSGTRYWGEGGGGAGLPAGSGGGGVYGPSAAGTLYAGGATQFGTGVNTGAGGWPGEQGRLGNPNIGNSGIRAVSTGSPGGAAIINTAFISGALNMNYGSNVLGITIPGTARTYIRHLNTTHTGDRTGMDTRINLLALGPVSNVTGEIVARNMTGGYANPSWVVLEKLGNLNWRLIFTSYRVSSTGTPPSAPIITIRFTVTAPNGLTHSFLYEVTSWGRFRQTQYMGGCCFTGDSMVTMADGNLKRIDEIGVGDAVKTPFGSSEVDWIRLPLLDNRPLLAMEGDKCKTSGEHCIWSKDPETGEQWWATRNMDRWMVERDTQQGPGLNDRPPIDLVAQGKDRAVYATEEGWKETQWTTVEDAPEDTQLYHLYLKDHASYFVDGFLVIGELPRVETLIDWTQFQWTPHTPQKPVYMQYDYTLPEVDRRVFKVIDEDGSN